MQSQHVQRLSQYYLITEDLKGKTTTVASVFLEQQDEHLMVYLSFSARDAT